MATHGADSAAGFILAGGQSSRMGTDKALALFGSIPLAQVALSTFSEAGVFARIAGFRSALGAFAEAVPDTFLDCGPLGGVHAGLSASRAEWNLFLPVDLPLMPSSLLACLLRRAVFTRAPVTSVRLNGRMEPFPVVLHGSVLAAVERCLQSGQTACYAAWQSIPHDLGAELDAVAVESLVQCGQARHPDGLPPALWFFSANTPSDLERLNAIHAGLQRPNQVS
jgi:molybdopterin-guanine dinucleotide biosynthesis protein A